MDTSEKKRLRPSCLKACGVWNTAVTTARAWRSWTTPVFRSARKKGRIDEGIARVLKAEPAAGSLGIAHTRWATHGIPCDENSHPHLDASGKIAVVHNGVIENYDALKQRLLRAGHKFKSDTDTEVLAHLIGEHYLTKKRKAESGKRK